MSDSFIQHTVKRDIFNKAGVSWVCIMRIFPQLPMLEQININIIFALVKGSVTLIYSFIII